jgi:hypothetical protein
VPRNCPDQYGGIATTFRGRPTRPTGPGEWSPGLRPKADALGRKGDKPPRPARPRERLPESVPLGSAQVLAALQAAWKWAGTQGIGLRPQPWALFCRPVGPVGSTDRCSEKVGWWLSLPSCLLLRRAAPAPRRGLPSCAARSGSTAARCLGGFLPESFDVVATAAPAPLRFREMSMPEPTVAYRICPLCEACCGLAVEWKQRRPSRRGGS